MTPFDQAVAHELRLLLRIGLPTRAVRVAVRELLTARIVERGPLDAREVSDAVQATMRAACLVVRELDASEELVDTVCVACLEAVRGHGGETARWLADATRAANAVLEELADERARRVWRRTTLS